MEESPQLKQVSGLEVNVLDQTGMRCERGGASLPSYKTHPSGG
jgi:hypothetical protein